MSSDTAISGLAASPVPVGRGEALGVRATDVALAVVLGCAALALYVALGLRLAQGQYLDYYNLAFDFDPARYVSTYAGSPADPGGFKHPLILLLRPLALPFLAAGFDPKQASVLVMTGFGGATVALCFLFSASDPLRPAGGGGADGAVRADRHPVVHLDHRRGVRPGRIRRRRALAADGHPAGRPPGGGWARSGVATLRDRGVLLRRHDDQRDAGVRGGTAGVAAQRGPACWRYVARSYSGWC